nr:hypothetical protein [Tanacetum cinerariifolium]
MTSITAQQTKLDLELVPKKNQFFIRKFNGRLPRGFSPKEPTFQVVLDALALTLCYPLFLITADIPEVYMHQFWNCIYKHDDFYRFKIDKKNRFKLTLEVFRDILQICPRMPQPWRTFAALINRSLSGKTSGLNKLRLSRAQIIWEMKESKAYKTYLGYAIGNVPPKVARKFKKASPSKKDSVPVPTDEEPIENGKRVKRSAKKSSIILTTEVALKKEAQMKEVRKKSLRKLHKSHLSSFGVLDVIKDDSTESESESWGNDDDDSNDEEGSERENDSEEHESDSEQDTDGNSASILRFNDRVTALEKVVVELKNDLLHT